MTLRQLLSLPESRYSWRQLARWLWTALRGNRLQATLNAAVGIIGVVLSLLTVWAMQRAVDIASGAREGSIYWAVVIMAVVTLAEFGVGISRVWIKNILGIKAQNRMQQQLLARLLRSEWRGREAMHSGDVITRLEQDVRQVVTFLTETLPSVLSTLALFIGAFIYLLQMDTWLAIITVAILPAFAALSRIYMAHMRRYSREVRKSDSLVQSLLTETVQHRMLVKTMEADEQMLDRLSTTQATLRSWVKKRTIFSVGSNLFLNLGFSLTYLIAFLWGALRLHGGTLTFGGMTAFLQLVNRIQHPARELTRLAPAFVGVFTATERLMELEETPEEQQGDPVMIDAPCGIRFDNVTFSYDADGQQPTLQNASFDFPPGSCTAILGETGAGKTTLIRLLLALVKPQQGTISIYSSADGSDDSENAFCGKTPSILRQNGTHFAAKCNPFCGKMEILSPLHRCNFVYVPQGNTLLSGTLRDNLRLGRADATDEEMGEVLRMACADFVNDLPNGLDTVFSEHGGGLSEGQAQRIAIARSMLRPGSIMLLDEATSALDNDTEQQLLKNLLEHQRRTVIFVTHRTSVLNYCDHVVRL